MIFCNATLLLCFGKIVNWSARLLGDSFIPFVCTFADTCLGRHSLDPVPAIGMIYKFPTVSIITFQIDSTIILIDHYFL